VRPNFPFASIVFAITVGALSTMAVGAGETLRVEQPWARPTPPAAKVGGAYLRLDNRGSADRLVAASTPVAASVELHTHRVENGVATMRAVPAIDLPAASVVEFKPGGLHLMLIGLKAPLTVGQTFALTLRFAQAGERTIEVSVGESPGRASPAASGHDHAH
jgi:periplasmic copper chaperone A